MLFFTEKEVRENLPMSEAIEAVEESLKSISLKRAEMPVRSRIEAEGGDILTMPAYVPNLGIFTVKVVSSYPENLKKRLPLIHAVVLVVEGSTGRPLAVMEGENLTAIRTGAATGVATKYLARRDARIVGLIGSGVQAWRQLEAVMTVRKIEEAKVYSPTRQNRESFAERASRELGVECRAVETAEEAVRRSDIIITATTSKDPVIKREWVSEGTHINAIGAYRPDSREIDSATVRDAKIVVDHKDSCLAEAGDLLVPISEGLLDRGRIYGEIGEIAAGLKPGRVSEDEITLFKSVGLAVEDAAAASVVLRRSGLL